MAGRYIAGTEIEDAVEAARRLNSEGIMAAIDNLGENVRTEAKAAQSVSEYLKLLDAIVKRGVGSSVSLKLTHLGLDVSGDVAYENAEAIVKKALAAGISVRLDMEGAAYTQRTLDVFFKLRSRYENVGVAIQSYLRRSAADVAAIIAAKGSVRLVKGAYKEPPQIAFPDKKDVDANFLKLMQGLLLNGKMPAIATHDESLVNGAITFAEANKIPKDAFEFEMLLGIKRGLQRDLADRGFRVRVYVPYGKNWGPYTLRRLRERKENIWFVLKNLIPLFRGNHTKCGSGAKGRGSDGLGRLFSEASWKIKR
ncbi:MAG: proline dehydrogenase family protein [Deltaproteobacteria bacterium]|nr:proline dehydrogenase family protein [Deltaproteobacteria bacterium]